MKMKIVEDNLTEQEQQIVSNGFEVFDKGLVGKENIIKTFNFVVRDPEFLGSLKARLSWGNFHIVEVYVVEAMRGKGIGTALIRHAINVAKKNNSTFVSIKTCNLQAKKLYEHIGFTLHNTMNGYSHNITFYTLTYKL